MASTQKYASLPDIDSAPDIYETPDTFPTLQEKEESSENEGPNSRSGRRNIDETSTREDLDRSHLPDVAQVGQKFRRAEKRRGRFREIYAYPESRNGSPSRSPSPPSSTRKPVPLNIRLQFLRKELDTLEKAVSDPSNPLVPEVGQDPDPEAMMRGLAEIRGRLDNIGGGESRGTGYTLVTRVLQSAKPNTSIPSDSSIDAMEQTKGRDTVPQKSETDVDTLGHLDKRLGELESLIGASNATLDENTPLPQPLLPHITRLSNILTLLTQPRHIDSVSRRLKLLLTDLERYSASSAARRQSTTNPTTPSQSGGATTAAAPPSNPTHDLAPVLARLAPALPTIPHLLTRLRTLSSLHASASGFASSLADLEEEQKRTRAGLTELATAVEGLEKSMEVNAERVEGNLKGLVERLEGVRERLKTVKT